MGSIFKNLAKNKKEEEEEEEFSHICTTWMFPRWLGGKDPLMQETWETRILSLGWVDPLEEEMATYSSKLACWITIIQEPGQAAVHGVSKRLTQLSMHTNYLNVS